MQPIAISWVFASNNNRFIVEPLFFIFFLADKKYLTKNIIQKHKMKRTFKVEQ